MFSGAGGPVGGAIGVGFVTGAFVGIALCIGLPGVGAFEDMVDEDEDDDDEDDAALAGGLGAFVDADSDGLVVGVVSNTFR